MSPPLRERLARSTAPAGGLRGRSGGPLGWLTYLILRGFFTRRPGQIVVGLVILMMYGGALWGVLPGQPGISWQGHLSGAVGGVLAAWWLAPPSRRPAGAPY